MEKISGRQFLVNRARRLVVKVPDYSTADEAYMKRSYESVDNNDPDQQAEWRNALKRNMQLMDQQVNKISEAGFDEYMQAAR